jgi:integrase
MMFNYALRHRWIAHNPASLVKKVREPATREPVIESNVLAPAEIKMLFDASDTDVRPIVMTVIYCGLREGELLGLQWADIDWVAGKLYVRRAWTSGGFVEPKTRAGRRAVACRLRLSPS